jgi:hydrogenase expression/formation protein HypD
MKFPHFDNPRIAVRLLQAIGGKARCLGPIKIMEVCGTHTMEIGRLGLRSILPKNIQLISGPGCPVCVTPGSYIDAAIDGAQRHGYTILTFGDMLRVPGEKMSLEKARSQGVAVEVVVSPLAAIERAKADGRQFVFLAVGFETTVPATAASILAAQEADLINLSFFVSHKIVPPALELLALDKDLAVSGFMLPGHVSAIIGEKGYDFLKNYKKPCVITGFEPLDILVGIEEIVSMLDTKESGVRNAYPRVVKPEGNVKALEIIGQVFDVADEEWRGIGFLPKSGLSIKKEFAQFDAAQKYALRIVPTKMPAGCACGDVLKGKITPRQCPLFAKGCTPENPVGPCMVSSEGSCAAYFKYER